MMDPGFQPAPVQCYAGYRGEEEPRRFHWQGREHAVTAILDRWLDPSCRYFKVRSDEGDLFMLRHHAQTGQWTLKPLAGDGYRQG
jgi:hypothetical protein